jgi:RNA polymerase sigma-70 factor (sigma-E family)
MPTVDGAAATPTRDAAVSALFMAEAPRLIAIAQLLTGDRAAAEDVVQDAFVTLYRRWSWLRDKAAARDYLMAAVVNGSRLTLRRRYAARSAATRLRLERKSPAPSAEAETFLGEQRRAVLDALGRLPLRQQQVVLLRYYADRSEREIAEVLGISRGSVKRHASRALASLTGILEASS